MGHHFYGFLTLHVAIFVNLFVTLLNQADLSHDRLAIWSGFGSNEWTGTSCCTAAKRATKMQQT